MRMKACNPLLLDIGRYRLDEFVGFKYLVHVGEGVIRCYLYSDQGTDDRQQINKGQQIIYSSRLILFITLYPDPMKAMAEYNTWQCLTQ